MKKFLSVILTLAIVLGNFSILFTGTVAAEEYNPNVLAGTTAADWHSGWSTSRNPVAVTDGTATFKGLLNYHSIYTILELKPNTSYDLSFSFMGDVDVEAIRLTTRDNISSTLPNEDASANNSGALFFADANLNYVTASSVSSAAVTDNTAWVNATATIKTGEATTYYLVLDNNGGIVGTNVNDGYTYFKDFSLTVTTNILAGTTAADWHSSWTTDDGYKPVAVTDGTATFKAYIYYHSVYTQVTLKPNTSYTLTFSYMGRGPVSDIDLTPVSNVSDPVTGNYAIDNAADTSLDYVKSASYGANTSATDWYTVTAEIKTGEETDYYLIIDGTAPLTASDSYTYFKDFSLTVETDVLKHTSAADWYSGWQASLKPTADSSGIATFSAKFYYHSIYTIVNLKPNTQYELNFTYVGDTDVENVRLVTENEIDTATTPLPHLNAEANNGGALALVDGATDYVTYKSIPTADSNTNTYNVSAIINTGDAITYYLILDNNGGHIDSANNKLNGATYFMDFSLDIQPNVMADAVMENSTWWSIWKGTQSNSVTNNYIKVLTDAEGYSGNAYAMQFVGTNGTAYRDNFMYVTLEPNTTYDFSFYYKGAAKLGGIGVVDASIVDLTETTSDYIAYSDSDNYNKLKEGYTTENVLGRIAAADMPGNTDGTTWTKVFTSFTTGEATEYILYLSTTGFVSGKTGVVSDFKLMPHPVAETAEVEDNNLLKDSAAENWHSSWASKPSATEADGEFKIDARWRSFFTKIALEPNTKYDFSFSFRNSDVRAIKVYSAFGINDPDTQLCNNIWVTGVTADLSGTEVISGKPATDGDSAQFYTASDSFTTGVETEYYIVVDVNGNITGDNYIYFKDLSLTEYVTPTPAKQLADPANWKAIGRSSVTFSSTADGKGVTTTGNPNWADTYATVSLEPNTKYSLSFTYQGASPVNKMYVMAASDWTGEYYNSLHLCTGALNEGASMLLTQSMATSDGYTYDGETSNSVSVTFTTTTGTEYFIIFDHGSGSGFTVSNISLEETPPPTPAEQYGTYTNWSSTRTSAVFSSVADGNGVTCTTDVSWVDTYATVTLEPYTKYTLSLNYQGDTKISNMVILAVKDSTRTSGHICNQISTEASYCLNTSMSSYTYSAATATAISVEFTTNANTEYYIIFDHGDDNAVGFTVSNISFEEQELDPTADVNDYTTWTSSWSNRKATAVSEGGFWISAAYRSIYTKVTLKADTTYNFSYSFNNVKVTNTKVYAASDITDPATQLLSGDNGGNVPSGDGFTNLASGTFTTNMPSDVTAEAAAAGYYTASARFTTTAERQYYIVIDCGAAINITDYQTNAIYVKDLSLAEEEKADDVVDTNMASGYSVESGHVIWSTKQDYINPSVLEDSRYTAKDDSSITYNGGKGWKITLNADTEDKALYGYIKAVGLKANTKYTFSYTYSMDYKVKLLDIIDSNADQVPFESVIQVLEEKADPLLRARKVNITFTTTDAADYLISLVTGYESEFYAVNGGKATVMVGDLVVDEYVEPTEEKPTNILENVSSLEWKSTWNTVSNPTIATITKATDSCNGGDGITVSKNNYRDAYTFIELDANSVYELKFKYKGTTELSHITVYAVDDVDASVLVNDSGYASVAPNSEISSMAYYEDIGKVFDGETWNDVTAKIATNENTFYYFALTGGANTVASGFTASDFSLVKVKQSGVDAYYDFEPEETPEDDAEQEDTSNLLAGYTYANWTGGNFGGASQDATSGDIKVSAAWRHAYTKVSLDAETTYKFSLKHRNAAVKDIYVYLASDVETDGKLVAASAQYYDFGSATNYATGTMSYDATITSSTLPDGTNYYTASESFTTGVAGDYYIVIEGLNAYDDSAAMYIKEASLEEVLPPTLSDTISDPANWNSTWNFCGGSYTFTVGTESKDGTVGIATTKSNYRDSFARVTLEANTLYNLAFNYKGVSNLYYVQVFAVNDIDATKTVAGSNLEHIQLALNEGASAILDQRTEVTYDGETWNSINLAFRTNANTEYYVVFYHAGVKEGAADSSFTASDFSLEEVPPAEGVGGAWITTSRDIIGGAETTEEDPEQLGKGYITYTCNNDSLILPFFYDSNSKYIVSFDIKGINAGTSGVQMQFHAAPNGRLSGEFAGSALTYRGDAVSVLRKDIETGKLLEAPFTFSNATEKSTASVNNEASSIYKGLIHTFTSEDAIFTDWQHFQIEIDPSAIYYEGLANLCFYGVGAQIAIDNFKVEVVPEDTLTAATEGFKGTYAYAIRSATENLKQGLRTVSTIDLSLRDEDANGFKVVEYGTLAVKKENLSGEELIYDMLDLTDTYKVKYGRAYSAADGIDKVYKKITDDSGKVTAVSYSGVLTGISATNFSADYAVRAYMILEDADGVRTVIYDEVDAQSVFGVTKYIKENATVQKDIDAADEVINANSSAYNTWNPEGSATKTASITVSTGDTPIITNYRGFSGTVYHAFGFMQDDKYGRAYSSDMLDTELDRLEDLGMVYMRTRFQSQWIFNDVTGYNWNSDRLGYFFDYAKALEERGMEVILQAGWHFDFISQEGTHSIQENDYFNGEGDDLYGESTGYDTATAAATVSDVTDGERIVKAARRYGYMVGQTLKLARARGVNNINYLAYFVEPSNSYSTPEGEDKLEAGHDKEEYLLFCQQMKQKLSEMGEAESVKHMGPNEAGFSVLLEYIISQDPDLFDINSAHFYNAAGDNFAEDYNDYYKRATTLGENDMEYDSWLDKIFGNGTEVNASNRSFENYKSLHADILKENTDSEFWVDEFNVIFEGANYNTKGTDNAWAGLALAMNAIAAQQRGMQNMVAWMAFDQLWSDRNPTTGGAGAEFTAGIHTTQNNLAPSLFMSGTPYTQYYTSGLFTKYNGSKGGSVYATNNDALQTDTNTQGVYVGAVKLADGNWTITVVNMRSEAMNINVTLTSAINQTLYRHMQRAEDVDANADAKLAGVDKTFTNVGTSLTDVVPAGSIAVYTGVAN